MIKNLEVEQYGFSSKSTRMVVYRTNDENSETKKLALNYPVGLTYSEYVMKGGQIIDAKKKPAYGFKLVKNQHDQYMYMRTSDNVVIPCIFDVATNFNRYGLAMVAKDGQITWINKDFQYINNTGLLIQLTDGHVINDGWSSISDFTTGEVKLSKCKSANNKVSFIDTDLARKKFKLYDGKELKEQTETSFLGFVTNFNEQGYAERLASKTPFECNYLVISSEGYYMEEETLLEKAIEGKESKIIEAAIREGMLDSITEEIKQLKK